MNPEITHRPPSHWNDDQQASYYDGLAAGQGDEPIVVAPSEEWIQGYHAGLDEANTQSQMAGTWLDFEDEPDPRARAAYDRRIARAWGEWPDER